MTEIQITAFHTQEHTFQPRLLPSLAEGYEQWLGDGYYFWQDEYFAKWWGSEKKCGARNLSRRYTIFRCLLIFSEDEFIDTVFNENDYVNFVNVIEKFAKKHQQKLGRKPTLTEFNEFLSDFRVWEEIKVIRFQDLPKNDDHVEVSGFFYKKRIQLRVGDISVVRKFDVHKTLGCI